MAQRSADILLKGNKNAFQRVFDYFKDLVTKFKVKRTLTADEKVQFDLANNALNNLQAALDNAKTNGVDKADSSVNYSIRHDDNGRHGFELKIDGETGIEYNEVTNEADWKKVLNKEDFAEFYNQLGNPHNFAGSRNGEKIVAVGNKLIFYNGDYVNPQISQVIKVNSEYETVIDEIREVAYEIEKGNRPKNGESYNIITDFAKDGSISVYKSKNRRAFSAGQIGRGKRKNSGRVVGKNSKRGLEIRFSDDRTESRRYFDIDEENDKNYSRTRKFAENVANSENAEMFEGDLQESIKRQIKEGKFEYKPVSNEKTLNKARGKANFSEGLEIAAARAVEGLEQKASSTNIATAELVLAKAVKEKNTEIAEKMIAELAVAGTETGA